MPETLNKNSKNNEPDVGKALEVLFASEYINKRKLYSANFVRGLAFGAGSAIGATIVLLVLLWLLSLFNEIPLIGPFADRVQESIKSR